MAEYYYTQNPESAHQLRTFTVEMGDRLLEFETDAGVFSKEHIDPAGGDGGTHPGHGSRMGSNECADSGCASRTGPDDGGNQ